MGTWPGMEYPPRPGQDGVTLARDGVPPQPGQDGEYPCQGWGPPIQGWGTPWAGMGSPPGVGQQMEYLIHGGWYASCVQARGLSCFNCVCVFTAGEVPVPRHHGIGPGPAPTPPPRMDQVRKDCNPPPSSGPFASWLRGAQGMPNTTGLSCSLNKPRCFLTSDCEVDLC